MPLPPPLGAAGVLGSAGSTPLARLVMFERLDYRMFDELGGVDFSYIILLSMPTLVGDMETERDRREREKEKEMKEEKTNPDAGLKAQW